MNELKLSLHNFQSISEGELTFQTGLNFIIGQSNSGKSATFRALKACLLNPAGSQRFIKRDKNRATVTLEYNGNEISWDKTNTTNRYFINGEEYRNTGKSDAFKILNDETGFVKAEKGNILMNMEEELQLPFPFGISEAELFKLFENVFCVSDSAVILKAAKEQDDNVKSNMEALDLESLKVQSKINNLQEFKEFVDLERLEDYKDYLKAKDERLNELKDGLDVIKLAVKLSKAKLEVGEKDFEDLFSPYLKALECKKALIQLKELVHLGKSLQELQYNGSNLKEKYIEAQATQKLVNELKSIEGIVLPEISFNSKIEHYNELKELQNTLRSLKGISKIKLQELSFESKLERLKELQELSTYIKVTLPQQISKLEEEEKREKERVGSIEVKLKEFKVCPLCHHSLE